MSQGQFATTPRILKTLKFQLPYRLPLKRGERGSGVKGEGRSGGRRGEGGGKLRAKGGFGGKMPCIAKASAQAGLQSLNNAS